MSKRPYEQEFGGVIKPTVQESTPWWPEPEFKSGAPNVVVVVLDDTGFSHLGCYGSTLTTPHIDQLAAKGLRYTGFHTTALCSPTRACLMTGRNSHSVGMRAISNFDTGFPNMRGSIPRSAATIAEVLRDNGYATYAAGKWHLAPMAECSAAGPFTNWPLQRGFDRFYGFLNGESDQFSPELVCDNHAIEQAKSAAEGYHFSEDVVDQASGFIRDLKSLVPEKPFFLYLAFGAMHSPHQAPQAYLDKYRGRFDAGWDVERQNWFERQKAMGIIPEDTQLAGNNPGVRPWAELSRNEQLLAARLQEAYAAMLEHTDAQIGRLIEHLKSLDAWDNTLFILMSDNGASQEGGASGVLDEMLYFNGMREDVDTAVKRLDDIGGPNSHSNIPWGWAQAGNSPLKWYKQNTHGGGVRVPMIMHWPGRLSGPGQTRNQFCHAIDIAPTLFEALGIALPQEVAGVAQMPMHGTSLVATFADAQAGLDRGPQYFEMFGHRAIWLDGWKAVTRHKPGTPYEDDDWELYHLDSDFSECRNLAASEPQRLEAMIALWWEQAREHGVLPLDDRGVAELFRASRRPGLPSSRNRFVYYPPISHIDAASCPSAARSWRTTVEIDHPAHGGDGALIARGNINSGFVLYIHQGRLHFDYNCFHEHTLARADSQLPPGPHVISLHVERSEDGGAEVQLYVDAAPVASARLPKLLFIVSSMGMDLGRSLSPVNDDYQAPFAYPGKIHKMVFDIGNQASLGEIKAQMKAEMARQ
ncbi:arylsulfatase [Comamonas composti]|uniref:arylsulfatase n=1 Tax=Comamonas composti TaxID=408558 RepID=UPI00041888B5|nr:arylsulfatase [Comamonas composti]